MSDSSELSLHDGSNKTNSLPDEFAAILERGESEGEETTKSEECLCSFFDQERIANPTLEEYKLRQLKEAPLFANVLTSDKDEGQVCIERPSENDDTSILVTGFGIRNLESLQDVLEVDARRRLYEFYDSQQKSTAQETAQEQPATISTPVSPKIKFSKKSMETETEFSSATSDTSIQQEKVRYLMGLEAETWEEEAYPQKEEMVRHMFTAESDKFIFAQTSTMRSAQQYLRSHRIFDFFQFLIAHILSAAPEDPVTFILVLLNKILLYRAGTGKPPLLYEEKHIEQLFKLMDRMNSGYMDLHQYESGMNTLGICEYNKNPELSKDELVSKEVFIREALDSETALFNDLIKRKWIGSKPKLQETFSDLTTPVRSYISDFNLLPSDLTRAGKQDKALEEIDEG